MRAKIALDVQSIFESQKTGIGWTVKRLVDCLTNDHELLYQLNYMGKYGVSHEEYTIQEYINKGCLVKHCPWMEMPFYRRIWNICPIPYHWMSGKDCQITQFFNYVIPPGVSGKKVLYIYDMAYKVYPETINKRTKVDLSRNLKKSCKRADLICTISNFSKNEIIRYMEVEADKIKVIPCGVDHHIFHTHYDKDAINKIKNKYGIQGSYFLYLGTLEPRKNVKCLVRAYILLLKRCSNCPMLVIAGKKGWLYEDIFSLIIEEKIQDKVVITGYVEENEVPILMNGAFAFLFPSLYEGFGLPVLEAMACGTPVITSSLSALPEVAGQAAILINPKIEYEVCEAMQELLEKSALRNQLIKAGMIHSQKFTWERAAKELKNVYMELLQ